MDPLAGGGEVPPKCVDGVAGLMNVLVQLVTGNGEPPSVDESRDLRSFESRDS